MLKEEEKKESIAYMNSLKEELKIVFQHTVQLEELLRSEQESHRVHYRELQGRSRYYQVNITEVEDEFQGKFKEKDVTLQSHVNENINIKRKHLELQQRFVRLSENHRMLSSRSSSDIQSLKQSKEMMNLSLKDRVEDLLSHKKYYKRESQQYYDYYKKTLNKLGQCYRVCHI